MGRRTPSGKTKFSDANEDREIFISPVQLTTSRIGNLTRLIYTLLYVTIHTHIHTMFITPPLAWWFLPQVEINETGTTLKFKPGYVAGGRATHECGTTRSLGWFIEGLLPLALFRYTLAKPVML